MDLKTGLAVAGATAGVIGLSTLVFNKKYLAGGVCNIKKDLKGQVIIVTGSNTGIGKETARVLASMGATIILACRDVKKTEFVVEELKRNTDNQNIEFIRLDLSELKSIREFAEEFKRRHQKLNILINNAGVMMIPQRTLTKDGFEMQFGTNHVGHFYLTSLLIDPLKKSAPSRIINLSSLAHLHGKMNWKDLMYEKGYNHTIAYGQSKLANVLFTKELQRRYGELGINSYSVHPGVVSTELTRYMDDQWFLKVVMKYVGNPFIRTFGKTALQGAQTSLYCALEDLDKLKAGGYYKDCKLATENKLVKDEENAKKLWDITEKLIASKITN